MDAYAASLPASAPVVLRLKLAQLFQGQGACRKAADHFELAGRLPQCVAQLVAHATKVCIQCHSTLPGKYSHIALGALEVCMRSDNLFCSAGFSVLASAS